MVGVFKMSETIDLTTRDSDDSSDDSSARKSDQTNSQEGQRKRQKTSNSRPKVVYVVIHDKEPQDSGSDYRLSSFLPTRQDTEIVGIYYNYSDAARAAGEYVIGLGFCDVDEDSNVDESDDEGPLSYIDWRAEGWYRQEQCDGNECHDRIHIQKHDVK